MIVNLIGWYAFGSAIMIFVTTMFVSGTSHEYQTRVQHEYQTRVQTALVMHSILLLVVVAAWK